MKDQRKNEIRVGITVLAGITILLFGISVFKQWSFRSDLYQVLMRFPVSAGLQVGDEVTINGVKAGKVSFVRFEGTSVLVGAMLDGTMQIREDAVARIQMLELMGGKKVEIRQGASPNLYNTGREIRGTVDPDIAGALGMLGSVEGDVRTVASEAGTALRNVNGIIGDAQMIAQIKDAVANMRAISQDIRILLSENTGNIRTVAARAASLSARADSLLGRMAPRVDTALGDAHRLAINADALVGDLRAFTRDITESRGLVHTALRDTTLAPRIDRLLVKLDSLASTIIDGQLRIKIRL